MKNYWLISRSEINRRNFGLDLVRCLAILFVLISHTLLTFYKDPSYRFVTAYFAVYGVELFFVLSGFLIGTILIRTNHEESEITFKSIKSFWMRRWFRTLPNYFLLFVIYLIVFKLYGLYIPYHKLPLYAVFLQNSFTRSQWFYGVSWSLSIEEWFYLSFPLLLLLAEIVFKRNEIINMLLCIICFLLFCLALRSVMSFYFHYEWDEGFRKQTPMRLDSIAIGVLAAMLKFYRPGFWFKNRYILFAAGLLVVFSLSLIMYFNLLKNDSLYGNFFMNTFFFTFISLAFAMLMPVASLLKGKYFKLVKYPVTYISLISYSIYLVHPIFCYIIPVYLPGKAYTVVSVLLLWATTFLSAYLIYHLYEKKMTGLREKITKYI